MPAPEFLDDAPAAQPAFSFDLIAQALLPLLERRSEQAFVLGIHGPWGSGKTTLMQLLQRQLRARHGPINALFIDFNAWKYQERQALWRALLLRVLGELRGHGADARKLDELEASLYRSFAVEEKGPWKVNWRTVIVEGVSLALSLVKLDFVGTAIRESGGFMARLLGFAGKPKKDGGDEAPLSADRIDRLASVLERNSVTRQVAQVQSIEQFLSRFAELVATSGRRVYVFVDDLDRCLPDSALEIFEAIKLFMDAAGCVYVMAIDREVIRKGLAIKYAQVNKPGGGDVVIDADQYIEKTISLSFDLPPLWLPDISQLIRQAALPIALDGGHEQMIGIALGANPRRVKRFMNTLALQLELLRLATGAGHHIIVPIDAANPRSLDRFLKLSLLIYRYAGLGSIALHDPKVLGRLEGVASEHARIAVDDPISARDKRRERLASEGPLLAGLHNDEAFWGLIGSTPFFKGDETMVRELLGWFRRSAVVPPSA